MDPLSIIALVGLIVVLVAAFVWPLTGGSRFFEGRRRTMSDVRRDLYTSSLDDGMYPLTPTDEEKR